MAEDRLTKLRAAVINGSFYESIEVLEQFEAKAGGANRRERIATAALQGLLAYRPYLNCHDEPALTAAKSVQMADALIAELGKGREP